jgi:ADP-ribose pyrophosphatase YjhB (NUDIX family)
MSVTAERFASVTGIVVDDQDRISLIQRRDIGHRNHPDDMLELDKTVEDCVEREALEETRIQRCCQIRTRADADPMYHSPTSTELWRRSGK